MTTQRFVFSPDSGSMQAVTAGGYNELYGGNEDHQSKLASFAKRLWIKELLSGKYPQGALRLHQDERYCCLGVLCEIFQLDSRKIDVYGEDGTFEYMYAGRWDKGTLPEAFAMELGISTTGKFAISFTVFDRTYYQTHDLAELNDSGLTFAQIADLVEYFF